MMNINKDRVCHEIAMEYAKRNLDYVLQENIPIFSGFEQHEVMLVSYHFAYKELMSNYDEILKKHSDRLEESQTQRSR